MVCHVLGPFTLSLVTFLLLFQFCNLFFFCLNRSSSYSPSVYQISQCKQWCWLGMLMGYKQLNSVWQLCLVYKDYIPILCILEGFNCRHTFISCQKHSLKIIKIPEVIKRKFTNIYGSICLFHCLFILLYKKASLFLCQLKRDFVMIS